MYCTYMLLCKHTHTHLLPPLLLAFVLGGLQHLLFPQVEEVGGVSVELERILLVIPERKEREKVGTDGCQAF